MVGVVVRDGPETKVQVLKIGAKPGTVLIVGDVVIRDRSTVREMLISQKREENIGLVFLVLITEVRSASGKESSVETRQISPV